MWKTSPTARALPSRPTRPSAKSAAWVSVHSEVPSPGTMTSAPRASRSITVQSPGKRRRGLVVGVRRAHDRHREPGVHAGPHQLVLGRDLIPGVADERVLAQVGLDDRPLQYRLAVQGRGADVQVLAGAAAEDLDGLRRVRRVVGQEVRDRAELQVAEGLAHRVGVADVGLQPGHLVRQRAVLDVLPAVQDVHGHARGDRPPDARGADRAGSADIKDAEVPEEYCHVSALPVGAFMRTATSPCSRASSPLGPASLSQPPPWSMPRR